ncbi:hypothetical protein [Candidatus Parabeggiatoa sp. HSG14]|uniref:hypothetical protein n=1 Tax=Candidatus Parabeggiatoa sp. HSG14 TaxID=3055593 RepID=UPI0025A81CED|nr:hypothetical protein [Thiotrichales bacterium HSG14]
MTKLRDIIELDQTHSQDAAIVLDYGLYNHDLVGAFTPTNASVNILKQLVRAVLPGVPQEQRAMNWFGSYGSGKSHLGVLAGQLLRDGAHTPEFTKFLRKLENFGENKLAEELRNTFMPLDDPDAKPYLLVPLYASQTPSLQTKLLEGLYKALKNHVKKHPKLDIKEILPTTEYDAAFYRFGEIIKNSTHYQNVDLSEWSLAGDYFTTEEMAIGLKRHEPPALKTFCLWHECVCHDAKFRPTDAGGKSFVEAYKEAGKNLAAKYHYGGIAIIWDELGNALEDLMRTQERSAVEEIIELQRFIETTCQPDKGHLLFLGLTHVSLAEYGTRSDAPQDVRDRLKTIEGRFTSLKVELKPSESEGYYLLGAQRRWTEMGHTYLEQSNTAIEYLASVCIKLPLFQQFSKDLAHIIRDCYPLHVITAAALFAISTRYAQATRTAFTFFRDLNNQTYERSIDESSLFNTELIRLPDLVEYYSDKMEKEASATMEMYRRAVAEVKAKGEICDSKVNILSVLLLSKVLGEHFQATDAFLIATLYDDMPNTAITKNLQKDLIWLKNAGLVWKNQMTGLWTLAGEAWIDPESLIKEAQQPIIINNTVSFFKSYPDLCLDLLPHLGINELELSPCGIIRAYSIDLLTSPTPKKENLSLAAHVLLVMAEDSEAAIQAQQICQKMPQAQVYYWIPREGTSGLNDNLRRYVAIEKLLKQSTFGEGLKRQLEARWEKNRHALLCKLSELFGRQGIISGKVQIFQAGEEIPLSCKSWHDFRIFLTDAVHMQDFSRKQLSILRLLAEVLKVSRTQGIDENEYARQAASTLRHFIKQLPNTVKEAPKLDDKARQLAKFFRAVGKTSHDLAELLMDLTDFQTELKSDLGAMNNFPQTRQQLTDIIYAFEKIKNERLYVLHQALIEQIPEQAADRKVLLEQLKNYGTDETRKMAQIIGTGFIDEKMIQQIVQCGIHKPFNNCTEIEIGQLIGKLKVLFDNCRKPQQPPSSLVQPISINPYMVAEQTIDSETLQLLKELRNIITPYQQKMDKKRVLIAVQQLYTEINT